MKKLVLTSVCSLAMAGAALAQGTINWSGPSGGVYTTQTNSQTYSPLFGGGSAGGGTVGATVTTAGSYYFELLYTTYSGSGTPAQPTTLGQLASWSDTGLSGANSTAVAGRNAVATSNSAQTVPWANGTSDAIMVVEWSANLGTTYAAALATMESQSALNAVVGNAYFGMSTTGYINPNVSPNTGPTIFATASNANGQPIGSLGSALSTQLYLIPVTPVPEPGTIAMAALGGLSLLAFRRKK